MPTVGPGRRVPDDHPWYEETQPGDYGIWTTDRVWYVCDPINGQIGFLGDAHTVVEHEDGTITVSPSILFSDVGDRKGFHGWLKAGIWSVVNG